MNTKINMYALVEKNSNRAIALVESGMVNWFKQNFPLFDVVEIYNVGTTSFRTKGGTINTTTFISESENDNGDVQYYMINELPDSISLDEAYELIK